MSSAPSRVLLVFVDGVGIGSGEVRDNPIVGAELPVLRGLLGGRLPVRDQVGPAVVGNGVALVAADARLGVEGLPQSGTGQTALLTGVNTARHLGRHFGPWVHTGLRDLLARENLLSRAIAAGRRASFANAYPAGFEHRAARRPAAPPLAALAAGVLRRHQQALREGQAVASSIDNEAWRKHVDPAAPHTTPRDAGGVLARIAGEADLTLFAHYDTDLVGHRGDYAAAVNALERVDRFLGGLIDALPRDCLMVLASDHGNVEDATTPQHTLNPVPVLAVGPGSDTVASRTRAITDVAPLLLDLLGTGAGIVV